LATSAAEDPFDVAAVKSEYDMQPANWVSACWSVSGGGPASTGAPPLLLPLPEELPEPLLLPVAVPPLELPDVDPELEPVSELPLLLPVCAGPPP